MLKILQPVVQSHTDKQTVGLIFREQRLELVGRFLPVSNTLLDKRKGIVS